MKVELQADKSTANPVEACLTGARNDYREESVVGATFEDVMSGTDKNERELVRQLLRRGHFGVFEHPQVFFAIEGVSRVTMAQMRTHRHLSFDVQSMRYVDFSESEPVVPETMEETESELSMYYTDPVRGNVADQLRRHWQESIEQYENAIERGVPKEDARFFLPVAAKVNMVVSGNIRAFLHVLDLRDSGAAQSEIQRVSKAMIEELREYCPIIIEEWEEHTKNASLQSP